jgi:hypothetical protein
MTRSIVFLMLLSGCGYHERQVVRYEGEKKTQDDCSVSCYSWVDDSLSEYCRNKLKDCAIID